MKNLAHHLLVVLIIFPILVGAQHDDLVMNTDSLRTVVSSLMKSDKLPQAISLAEKILSAAERDQDSLGVAKTLYLLSRAHAFSGNFNHVIEIGERGSRLSGLVGDHLLELKTNNTLSWAYFETGKDFNKTLKHQQRQVLLASLIDDPSIKAPIYNNYGYDTTVGGSIPLDNATAYAKYANDFYANDEGTEGRWYTLMNLTWQFRLKGDMGKSEEYGRKAVAQAKNDKDRHAIVEANTNLGETLLAQDKTELATEVYQAALRESLKKIDRDKYVFDVYYAKYLWETGKKSEAMGLLKKAVDFLTDGEVFYEMIGRATLARFYFENHAIEKALEQIQIIENPRSNYVSFESRFNAALIKYRILKEKEDLSAAAYIQPFLDQANDIGAKHLTAMFND